MDELTANQFMTSLVKSVQALCNGYIDFTSSIEVVGHIHLNIDHKVKLDYILTEEVSRSIHEDATLFSSHSYHSKPPESLTLSRHNSTEKLDSPSCSQNNTNSSRRKSQHVPRVDDSESFSFSTDAQVTSQTQAKTIVATPLTDERTGSFCPGNMGKSHESTTVQNTEENSWQTAASSVPSTSSLDRRRKSSTSGIVSPAAKHRRTSDTDSKPDLPDPLVMVIKEEPEDDASLYQSSIEETSAAEDMAAPDFGSVVMESLDHVDQKDVTAFMTDDQDQHMQVQPYPVMLHATPKTSLTAVSLPMPGSSINTTPAPSTSAGIKAEEMTRSELLLQLEQGVQTPYTIRKNLKSKTWPKVSRMAKRQTVKKAAYDAAKAERAGQRSHRPPPAKKCSNYLEYTMEDMDEAIELIHGGMSVIDAALKFGIPRATLFNRSRDGCKTHSGRCSEVFLRTHVGTDCSKKRVKSTYTRDTMEKAIEAVHEGMPVIDAAIKFDIPRASLFIRSGRGCPTHSGRCSTVSSDGKLKRSKVSRFRYLELMQEKSASKPATDSSNETSGKESAGESASIKIPEISQIPDKYNPKVKLVKIPGTEPNIKIEKDDSEMSASGLKTSEMGVSALSRPTFDTSTSEPGFGMSSEIPEPSFELDVSGSVEEALKMHETERSKSVFETLAGTVVVKIEADDDIE